jgi:hypothetical protein
MTIAGLLPNGMMRAAFGLSAADFPATTLFVEASPESGGTRKRETG